MATKRKSIIEEALLDAKSLEDALKANTKEMLATHMKQEIESIVESSLKVKDEESKSDIVEGSGEKTEVPVLKEQEEDEESEELVLIDAGEDSEEDAEDAEADELELDLDLDALADDLEDAEEEIEVAELPIDLDLGDDEELDLTGASDEEVIAVFKKMGNEDEVEVIKDEDGIHLTDNETGAEYYIKESEEVYEDDELCEGGGCGDDVSEEIVYEIELDEHDGAMKGDQSATRTDYAHYKGTDKGYHGKDGESHGDQGEHPEDYLDEGGARKGDQSKTRSDYAHYKGTDKGYHGKDGESHGDQGEHPEDYLDEGGARKGDQSKTRSDYAHYKGTDKGYHGKDGESHGDQGEHPDDYLEEDKTQNNRQDGAYGGGRQRYGGQKAGTAYANENRKSRKPLSARRRTPKNAGKVTDSKIVKEYKELKKKNEEYKQALKVFKNKLNEVALFNTNLAYVNRLFTEHSTTKTEKMQILKKFDGAESIKESKNIYKAVKGELDTKSPITESVENKVNKTVKSSKSDLNESTAYVDPQITAIKDLMKRIS